MPGWVIDILWFCLTWLFLVPASVTGCWLIVIVITMAVIDRMEG